MKNPLSILKLDTSLINLKDSVFTTFGEFKKTKKYENSQQCDVLLIYPTGAGEVYRGLTDETNAFLFVPILMRVYTDAEGLHPTIISGKKLFIVSSQYHGTINLIEAGKITERVTHNASMRIKVSQKLKHIMNVKWHYDNDIIEFKVKNIPNPIPLDFYNNKWSISFTAQSFLILQTKNLAFLEEVSRRVFLLSLAFTAAVSIIIGMIMGIIMTFIGSGLLFAWLK